MKNTFIPDEKHSAEIKYGPEGRVLWQESYSPYGVNLGLCLSALTKTMRVNNWRDACWFAHQLFISGENSENWVWRALRTFCVEDIGLAEVQSIVVIGELERTYFSCPSASERRYLAGFSAVRYLSKLPKDRSNDEAYAAMIIKLREGAPQPSVPDCAYDYHLKVGREKGRGLLHFFTKATVLSPDHSSLETTSDKEFLIDRAKQFEND